MTMTLRLRQKGEFTIPRKLAPRLKRMLHLTIEDEAKRLRRDVIRGINRKFRKGEGDLARSVEAKRTRGGWWSVGSDLPYAAIREHGGIIRPRRRGRVYQRGRTVAGANRTGTSQGKKLAIPAPAFRKAARHKTIDKVAASRAGGAAWGTFARGNALMFRIGRAAPVLLASLVDTLHIRGKPVWIPAFKKSRKRLVKTLVRRIRRVARGRDRALAQSAASLLRGR